MKPEPKPYTFADMLKQARALPDSELARHALVSRRYCHFNDCFCCACKRVEEERRHSFKPSR